MRIVIIGSESFVGKELKKHCDEKSIDYVGLDLAPSEDSRCHQVDMCSENAAEVIPENADAFVHHST